MRAKGCDIRLVGAKEGLADVGGKDWLALGMRLLRNRWANLLRADPTIASTADPKAYKSAELTWALATELLSHGGA